MPRPLRVLMIEDSDFDSELLLAMLDRGGYQVTHTRVETAADLRKALEKDWDIVIADYNIPQFDGPAALEILKKWGKKVPFFILSGGVGRGTPLPDIKAGATNVLVSVNVCRPG